MKKSFAVLLALLILICLVFSAPLTDTKPNIEIGAHVVSGYN